MLHQVIDSGLASLSDAEIEWGPGAKASALLDGLPIAAAIVELRHQNRFEIVAPNERFSALDLGPEANRFYVDLIKRIDAFEQSSDRQVQFTWKLGDDIAGRDLDVTLSRLNARKDGLDLCVMALIDRTNQIQTEKNLRHEMVSDALTGLPNRGGFEEAVDKALTQPEMIGAEFAIMVIDLARFSRINEAVGPLAGDELIITVARERVETSSRSSHAPPTAGPMCTNYRGAYAGVSTTPVACPNCRSASIVRSAARSRRTSMSPPTT